MNKLKCYLKNVFDKEDFAKRCGTTFLYLKKAMYDTKILGPKICVQVELVTNGVVTRKDLRPNDWQEIWPELVEKGE